MCDTVDADGLEDKKSNYKSVKCVENRNMEATSNEISTNLVRDNRTVFFFV
jgi:hypothetical protein